MVYSRAVSCLTQEQAIGNLRTIFEAEYFNQYEFWPQGNNIISDMMSVDSIGDDGDLRTPRFLVGDLSDTVLALLTAIEGKGTLYGADLRITPSNEGLNVLGFDSRIARLHLRPSLIIKISRYLPHPLGAQPFNYSFHMENEVFSEFGYNQEGLNFRDVTDRLSAWYGKLDETLKEILPHTLSDAEPLGFEPSLPDILIG